MTMVSYQVELNFVCYFLTAAETKMKSQFMNKKKGFIIKTADMLLC
ncbi:GSCOCG00009467001-RA-CDS [Cotesia congregata]|nr:GSCOCG00009467001-RA-CDS [Cotesia congregata]